MASGAPDYQRVFTLVPPSMTHGAPDWQETAVGPGGEPVSAPVILGQATAADVLFVPAGVVTLAEMTLTNTAPGYAVLAFGIFCEYTVTVAAGEGFVVQAGGDITGYSMAPLPQFQAYPGVLVTDAIAVAEWCGLVYLTQAAALVALALQATGNCHGVAVGSGNAVMAAWT